MKSKKNIPQEQPPVSKSQRRRDALELKSLAADLIKLSPARLASVPLDDSLVSAIEEARQFRSHGARKRQLQYVAKLLRRDDPEPIFQALEEFDSAGRQLIARQHRVESWRDCLLESGDQVLGVLLRQRRDADAQAFRQLIRNAQKESARGQPPAAARALFRLLRELDQTEPWPATPGS